MTALLTSQYLSNLLQVLPQRTYAVPIILVITFIIVEGVAVAVCIFAARVITGGNVRPATYTGTIEY